MHCDSIEPFRTVDSDLPEEAFRDCFICFTRQLNIEDELHWKAYFYLGQTKKSISFSSTRSFYEPVKVTTV